MTRKDFCSKNVLIVGGGDSAVEAAMAISECGGEVTVSYRGEEFNRPKPENQKRLMKAADDRQSLNLAAQYQRQGDQRNEVTWVEGQGWP